MEYFKKTYGRNPLEIKRIYVVETLEDLDEVYTSMYNNRKKKLLIGYDTETISNPCIWNEYDKKELFYKPVDPFHCGPYIRTIQLADPSGRVVVIDFGRLAHNQEEIVFKKIKESLSFARFLLGFNVNCEITSLKRSLGIIPTNFRELEWNNQSLESMVREKFGIEMKNIQESPSHNIWKKYTLPFEAIRYAALDALATLDLYLYKIRPPGTK